MGVSHIVVKKGGILFWEEGVDSGRVAYRCLKWGYILCRRVDSVSVAYRCLKGGYILGGRGRLWECRIHWLRRGIFWRDGYTM